MAAGKKTAKGTTTGKARSASEFIRQQAHKLHAKEVVELAKKAGFAIKETYVYSIRSKSKGKGKVGKRGKSPGKGAEAAFREALHGITMDRAREIIEEIEAAYSGS